MQGSFWHWKSECTDVHVVCLHGVLFTLFFALLLTAPTHHILSGRAVTGVCVPDVQVAKWEALIF